MGEGKRPENKSTPSRKRENWNAPSVDHRTKEVNRLFLGRVARPGALPLLLLPMFVVLTGWRGEFWRTIAAGAPGAIAGRTLRDDGAER